MYPFAPNIDEVWLTERLRLDESSMFLSGEASLLQVLRLKRGFENIQKFDLQRTVDELEPLWPKSNGEEVFIIIRQDHSWTSLQVTRDVFEKLLRPLNPCVYLFDFARGFCLREDNDTKTLSGYRWQVNLQQHNEEFTYVMRYYAQNGRDYGDPWSLRQTCVYEQRHTESDTSAWLMIQPSVDAYRRLQDCLQSQLSVRSHSFYRSIQRHTTILFMAARSWPEYVDFLRSEVEFLESKACYSSVDKAVHRDYSLAFSDCQRIQEIRRKLFRAERVLKSNMSIIEGCQIRWSKFAPQYNLSSESCVIRDLDNQNLDLQSHQHAIQEMIEYSKGTMHLLSKILETRHDETMRTQTQLLTQLSADQKKASEEVARLQIQAASDSKLLKSLNSMAALYLPVSLVLAFFGTNFVQVNGDQEQAGRLHIIVVEDVWMLFASSIPLLLLTVVFIALVGRRTTKKSSEV